MLDRLWRKGDRQGELLAVLGHGEEGDPRRVRTAVELGERLLEEGAGQLASAIGAEVEEQADVALAHAMCRGVAHHGGSHELVVLAALVAASHGRLSVGRPLTAPVHEGVVGELDPIPARVSVHGEVAPHDGTETSHADVAQVLVDLGQVRGRAARRRVAPIEEGMHHEVAHALATGHLDARLEMPHVGVHSAV